MMHITNKLYCKYPYFGKKISIVVSSILLAGVYMPETAVAQSACSSPDLCLYNGGRISGFSPLTGFISNGQSARITNDYEDDPASNKKGHITVNGDKSPSIYVRMRSAYDPNGATGTITVINKGILETGTNGNTSRTLQHGMALGFSITSATSPKTAGDVFVTNSGSITTYNPASGGIYIKRHDTAAGTVTVDNSAGTIKILNTSNTDPALVGDGIHIEGGRASVEVDVGNIEIPGLGTGAYLSTAGKIEARLGETNKLLTKGSSGDGIMANSTDADVSVNIDGDITVEGEDANGVVTLSPQGKTKITIGDKGSIQGGRGTGSALVIGGTSVEIINNGDLSALSDRLIAQSGSIGATGNQKVTNNSSMTMTGFLTLGKSGGNSFQNNGRFVSRNFSAPDPDGIRKIRAVAINDMGGSNSQVVNETSGVIVLGASDDASTFDSTGYYAPRTGFDNRLFSPSVYNFARAGFLQSQFVNTDRFTNRGLIDLTGSQTGNTLVITSSDKAEDIGTGTYVSDGGTLKLGVVLNDASISQADMLIVDRVELASAPTKINVVVKDETKAGLTLANGIQLVQVRDKNSTASAAGAFILSGANTYLHEGAWAIGSGAYAYKLYQNGLGIDSKDGNWYLRSQLDRASHQVLYQAGVPVYDAYPQILLGMNEISTLQQRVGNRLWSTNGNNPISQGSAESGAAYTSTEKNAVAIDDNGIWARIEGSHAQIEPRFSASNASYKQDIIKLKAGIDRVLYENETSKLIGGLVVHYARGMAQVASPHGDGKVESDGYGFGGTLTWYDENGLYFDAQAEASWYRSDLSSVLLGKNLTDTNSGFGYALSIESGKRIAINQAWSMTPQAQMVYSSINFNSFTDVFGATVSLDRGNSLEGRLGVSLDYENSWQNDRGMLNRSHIYGTSNLYYDFLSDTKVTVADTAFTRQDDNLWAGLGLGGSYSWNDDKYSLYGETLVKTSLNNFGKSFQARMEYGFRVKW